MATLPGGKLTKKQEEWIKDFVESVRTGKLGNLSTAAGGNFNIQSKHIGVLRGGDVLEDIQDEPVEELTDQERYDRAMRGI